MFYFSLVACFIKLSRQKEDHKSGEQILAAYGSKLPPRPSVYPFDSGNGVVACGGDAKKKKSTNHTRSAEAAAFVAAAVGDVPPEKKKRARKRKHVDSSGNVITVAVVALTAGGDDNEGGDDTRRRNEGKARVAVKQTTATPACRLFGKFVVVPFAFDDAPPVDWIGRIVAERAVKDKVYFQALFEEDGQKVWYEQQEVKSFFFAVHCA